MFRLLTVVDIPVILLFEAKEAAPALEAPDEMVDVIEAANVDCDIELVVATAGTIAFVLFTALDIVGIRCGLVEIVFVSFTPLLVEALVEGRDITVKPLDIDELVAERVRVMAPALEELANVTVLDGCNDDAIELTTGVYPYGIEELSLCAAGNMPRLELAEPVMAPTAEPFTVVEIELNGAVVVRRGVALVDCEPD